MIFNKQTLPLLMGVVLLLSCKKDSGPSLPLQGTVWELQQYFVNNREVPVGVTIVSDQISIVARDYYVFKGGGDLELHKRFNFLSEEELDNTPSFVKETLMDNWQKWNELQKNEEGRYPRNSYSWKSKGNNITVVAITTLSQDPRNKNERERIGHLTEDNILFFEYRVEHSSIDQVYKLYFKQVDHLPDQLQY
ncbi:hypothetical protein [Gynurincola endophyticus]|uniref:hypothetical protein n=1 Tax=Gynurincola endophyticus TaxID=2479004 RepID=UPI000F8D6710|nr:hypothetical protein [Gynurincola endophyticus]